MKPFTRILSGVTRYFSQGFDELIPSQPSKSRSLDFNFPYKRGTGLAKMIPFGTPECRELLLQLLIYDPDDRMSARQAIRHPFFREMRYVRHSFPRLSRQTCTAIEQVLHLFIYERNEQTIAPTSYYNH